MVRHGVETTFMLLGLGLIGPAGSEEVLLSWLNLRRGRGYTNNCVTGNLISSNGGVDGQAQEDTLIDELLKDGREFTSSPRVLSFRRKP